MRKYLRSIARHRMKTAGLTKVNRGYFRLNWRKHIKDLLPN